MDNGVIQLDYWICKEPSGSLIPATFKESKELSVDALLKTISRPLMTPEYLNKLGYKVYRVQITRYQIIDEPDKTEE